MYKRQPFIILGVVLVAKISGPISERQQTALDGLNRIFRENLTEMCIRDRESDTVLIGTREFAAPEQYGFAQSDARTDIYALGVMINYLLTGRYPKEKLYHSENDQKRYRGGTLADIIGKCTAFAPDMRYQDISELQKALSVSDVPEKKMDDRCSVGWPGDGVRWLRG